MYVHIYLYKKLISYTFDALQVIQVCEAAAPRVFNSNYLLQLANNNSIAV